MAENIGKIVVAIEAEVAQLRKGLAQAEAEFKKSAKKIEEQQKTLGEQFKRSWTEISSKINVVTVALNVAGGVLNGLTGAMQAFGEKGASSGEKVGGAILAFGNAGIPIISNVIKVSEALANVWLELTGQMEEIILLQEEQARTEAFVHATQMAVNYKMTLQAILQTQKLMTQGAIARAKGEEDVTAQFQLQRQTIEQGFAEQNALQDAAMEKSGISEKQRSKLIRDRLILQNDILLELDQREDLAMEAWKQREADKQRILEENAEREKQRAIKNAKAIADKTMDLQTRLDILRAKMFGDEEAAQRIAIEARYDKMLEHASEVDAKIIRQMRFIELRMLRAQSSTSTPDVAGGGGTANVGTAIGSFTVATGRTELRKQTNLLRRIARATERMGAGEVVVLAA